MSKLQKQLLQIRSQQGDSNQLTSLQDELERLKAELEEAHAQRKRLEEVHNSEKLGLEQVRGKNIRFKASLFNFMDHDTSFIFCIINVVFSSEGGGAGERKFIVEA